MRQTDKQTHCLLNVEAQQNFASPCTPIHLLLLSDSLVNGSQQTTCGISRHAHTGLGLLQRRKPGIRGATLRRLMRPLQLLAEDPATDDWWCDEGSNAAFISPHETSAFLCG